MSDLVGPVQLFWTVVDKLDIFCTQDDSQASWFLKEDGDSLTTSALETVPKIASQSWEEGAAGAACAARRSAAALEKLPVPFQGRLVFRAQEQQILRPASEAYD